MGTTAVSGEDERDYGESDSEVSVDGGAGCEAKEPEPVRRPLEPIESLAEQMARMKALRETTPAYADAIMLQGSRLVDFAATGALIRIMEIVHGSEPGELLYWHTAKMFRVACENGHPDVVSSFDSGPVPLPSLHPSARAHTPTP